MYHLRSACRSLLAITVFSGLASATPIPLGILSFDSGPGGSSGVFDILNLTGPNSTPLPDASFPVTTPVTFFNPTLTIDFLGGGMTTLDSSHFTSDGSGGFTGLSQFNLASSPIADAILSGDLSPASLTLNNGGIVNVNSTFSSFLVPSAGGSLAIGDFAVLYATPEPASWVLMGGGLIILLLRRRVRRAFLLSLWAALAQVSSWATTTYDVTLHPEAQPATGQAGVTTETVTGSGFPSGTITPAQVKITFAATCNGTAVATTKASTVQTVATLRRIAFAIPAMKPGAYQVSVSGTVSGASFATSSCAALTVQQADKFVRVVNGELMFQGFPFRFGGGNDYHLMFSDHATVDQMLQAAVNNGFKVIRMWAFDDVQTPPASPNFWLHALGGGTPSYNDTATGLGNVDYAIYRAGQLGLKLIIPFTNNWPDYGGMDEYVTARGETYHDQFYTDATIRQWYKAWISHVLNHKNTISGVVYKNDPTIMIWELANEPRCAGTGLPSSGTCTVQTIQSWIADSAAYMKSVDPRHLVAVGDEGFFCNPSSSNYIDNCSSGVDTLAFSETANIDLMGFHLYPEGWGQTIAWADTFIDQHLMDAAHVVGKPAYLGEYGLMSGNDRNAAYKDWTDRVLNEGGSGALFWDLAPGEPEPTAAENDGSFDLEDGAPLLLTIDNFEKQMAANSVLSFPPVADDVWATTPFNQTATLNPVANDVAYAGATIDPSTIDLDPSTPGIQTSVNVYGGTFAVSGGQVQFTPTSGFNGTTLTPYTVDDSNQQLSNVAYLFATVQPSAAGSLIIESFETGTDGWGPLSTGGGTVSQSTIFHTDGTHSLAVNVAGSGWFGVNFPTAVDVSNRPTLSIDVETTSIGGGVDIAIQSGASYDWCQGSFTTLGTNSTTTISIPLDPAQLTCFGSNPDMTQLHAVWIYLNAPGTYYLDFLRAAPVVNPANPIGIESFETGVDGWHSINGMTATIAQTTAFHTDGSDGLSITTASGVSDWFGNNLSSPLNLSGKTTLKVDLETTTAGTSTAIAVQSGSSYAWCQTMNWGYESAPGTITISIPLDPAQLTCFNPADFTSVRAVWVWISGGGTFYLDNVRAE